MTAEQLTAIGSIVTALASIFGWRVWREWRLARADDNATEVTLSAADDRRSEAEIARLVAERDELDERLQAALSAYHQCSLSREGAVFANRRLRERVTELTRELAEKEAEISRLRRGQHAD